METVYQTFSLKTGVGTRQWNDKENDLSRAVINPLGLKL